MTRRKIPTTARERIVEALRASGQEELAAEVETNIKKKSQATS